MERYLLNKGVMHKNYQQWAASKRDEVRANVLDWRMRRVYRLSMLTCYEYGIRFGMPHEAFHNGSIIVEKIE